MAQEIIDASVFILKPIIKRLRRRPMRRDAERALEKLIRSTRLYCEVQNAARDIPEGFEISIQIERGCGTVKLIDDKGFDYNCDGAEFVEDQIAEAVDLAKRISVKTE